MVIIDCKCVICGESTSATTKDTGEKTVNRNSDRVFYFWRDECARTMCDILFGSETHSLFRSLKNSQHCNSCQQIVRDVNFTYKQIKSFQRTLDKLTHSIRKRIQKNYSRLEKRCEKTEDNLLQSDVPNENYVDIPLNANYFHEELTRSIYAEAEKFLNKVPFDEDETISEDIQDDFPTVNVNTIKQEPIKVENEEAPWNSEDSNSCDIGEPSNEESLTGTKWEKMISDDKRCLNPRELKEKKRKGSQKKLEKKDMKPIIGKIARKRGRPRKYFEGPASKKTVSGSNENSGIVRKRGRPRKYFEGSASKKTVSGSNENSGIVRKRGRPRKYFEGSLPKKTVNENGDVVKKVGRPRKYFEDSAPKETVSCTYENCSLMFTTEDKMKVHVRGFHEGIEKPHECYHIHCSESFSKRKELITHVKKVHDTRKKKAYACKFCGKGYESEEELSSHYSEAHLGPNPFICAFCSDVHSNSVSLRLHVKKAHPDPEDLLKPYCEICDKYFSNQNNYNMHRKWQHTNPELIPTCHECNLQFSSRGALQKHMKCKHEQEKKYTCETCGKGFSYVGVFTEHIKIHDKSKRKFACTICAKTFHTVGHCKKHEVSHTGIKEFICQMCGKTFGFRGNLIAHIKLHTRDEYETDRMNIQTQYHQM